MDLLSPEHMRAEFKPFEMPAKDIPFLGSFDVLVCGAGPAGIGAAVAAARGGSRTLLIERFNSLGGIGSGTSINRWGDSPGGEIFDELEKRMSSLGKASREFDPARHTNRIGRVRLHGETLKAAALKLIREAGAGVLFGVLAVDAVVDGGRVKGVIAATKDGLRCVKAKVVIDTTADAGISAAAGAGWLKGDEEDGRLMHIDFMFEIDGVDYEKYLKLKPSEETIVKLLKEAHDRGAVHPPSGAFRPGPELFPYHMPERKLLLNRWVIENVDCSNPVDESNVLAEGQFAAFEVIEFCRKNLPGYENCGIGRFWEMLGARESRRIEGHYTLTEADVLEGRKFSDGIARASFFIDFHDSPPGKTIPYTMEFKKKNSPPEGDYYEIPYRCLIPKNMEGLLTAGRCISADRAALASLRVMPTCMYTGEAAGRAAAMAVREKITPAEVDTGALRKKMGLA